MEGNYWDHKANEYDDHLKKSGNAYLQVIDLIKKEMNGTQTILDVGTGTGEIPISLSNHAGKIITTDFLPEMIKIANLKIEK